MKKLWIALILVVILVSCDIKLINENFLPGEYEINKTLCTMGIDRLLLTTKVQRLIVNEDYTAEIILSWEAKPGAFNIGWITKYSDEGNAYLMDDLGNKYIQYEVTGGAAEDITFSYYRVVEGTYKFHTIDQDAKILTFYDDDNGKSVEIRFK